MAQDSAEDAPAAPYSLRNYRLLGKSGLRVSPLCLGTMTFGNDWHLGEDQTESKQVWDAYVNEGGNFFDTANVYTNTSSERFVGQFIGERRSDCVVATKYSLSFDGATGPNRGGNGRKSLAENLDASLRRMGLGAVDLLYVHAFEYRTPTEEIMRALDDAVRSGKAYYVGCSDIPAWAMTHCNTLADLRGWSRFVALQTRYNLCDRSFEFDLQPASLFSDVATVTWGAVAEGFLTGKYERGQSVDPQGRGARVATHMSLERNWAILDVVKEVATEVGKTPAQVAINWQLAQGVTSPLLGARNLDQIRSNLEALSFELTPEQLGRLNAVSSVPTEFRPFPLSFIHANSIRSFLDGGMNIAHRAPFTREYLNRLL